MSEAKYDTFAEFYAEFVAVALSSPTSVLSVVTEKVLEVLGEVEGRTMCEVACGEGHLTRRLAELGALVTGVDVSQALLKRAGRQTPASLKTRYVHDDAQTLASLENQSFDAVVINMALMDIPDHKRTFDSCRRILKPGGTFVFSILHPCFESPFDVENQPVESSDSGEFLACRVSRYREEGFWTSGGDGVRGRVGAYHRTLSTYLNDLLASGFQIQAVHEPALSLKKYAAFEEQWFSKIPRGLVLKSYKP